MKCLAIVLALFFVTSARADFTEEFPELKKHVFVEPQSPFYFGFGTGLLGFLSDKALHTINVFQLHLITGYLDWEIFSASLGISSFTKDSFASSRHFTFRTVPKIRPIEFLSFGPVIGFEYVSFPKVDAQQTKDGFVTPVEPFSSKGMIYGVMVSETFKLKNAYLVRVSQLAYKQTYPTDRASNGWEYKYANTDLQADPEKKAIRSSYVFMLEFSVLF